GVANAIELISSDEATSDMHKPLGDETAVDAAHAESLSSRMISAMPGTGNGVQADENGKGCTEHGLPFLQLKKTRSAPHVSSGDRTTIAPPLFSHPVGKINL